MFIKFIQIRSLCNVYVYGTSKINILFNEIKAVDRKNLTLDFIQNINILKLYIYNLCFV